MNGLWNHWLMHKNLYSSAETKNSYSVMRSEVLTFTNIKKVENLKEEFEIIHVKYYGWFTLSRVLSETQILYILCSECITKMHSSQL